MLVINFFFFFFGGGVHPVGVYPSSVIYAYLLFWTGMPFYFILVFFLLFGLFYTSHLVSISLFYYDYLNSVTIKLCPCFYSLYYNYVNLNFISSNNNLYIHLSFHFTYDIDKGIIDFEIYLSIISNDVILMLLYPHIFKWFFDTYTYITYVYLHTHIYHYHIHYHIHNFCTPSWSLDVSAILYR